MAQTGTGNKERKKNKRYLFPPIGFYNYNMAANY
jgi:hypothetical protein